MVACEEKKVQNTDEKPIYFDRYDPNALHEILDTKHKTAQYMKYRGHKRLLQILIITDDFADGPDCTRKSQMLHTLYIRGRHNYISTITATQKFNALHPIIRVNATELFVYRLRNMKDLETFIDEVSTVVDKKPSLELYHTATSEHYSFL